MIRALLMMSTAWAGDQATEAAHGAHGIPWGSLFVQTFNISFLLIILFILMRKTVKAHFEHRARDYQQMVSRAETARAEAEKGKREVKERLSKLEASSDHVMDNARSEAQELRSRMVEEAKTLATRLQQEAERTVKVELEKAKTELRAELMAKAIDTSRENLKKNLSSTEQTKLQKEFAEKIQVVGG